MSDATYKGVPLDALRIEEVTWSDKAADHMRSRPVRQPGARGVEPEWATEAALSDDREVRLAAAASQDTASLKIVGTSGSPPDGPALLKVWIWTDDPRGTTWQGASAAFANDSDVQRHERRSR